MGVETPSPIYTYPIQWLKDLVASREFFAVVQLAVSKRSRRAAPWVSLQLAHRSELVDYLRLDEAAVGHIRSFRPQGPRRNDLSFNRNPHQVPLVQNLLRLAGESRRRNGPALVSRLEGRIDELHRVVRDLGERVGDRLRDAKLSGLAELAAGAGHEINNPLAIISSNAQRMLRSESDLSRVESLQADHPTGEPDRGTTPRSHAFRPSADAESACVRCV